MCKLAFVVGIGVGYVLGTRAGREQYEKIVAHARELLDDPTVRQITEAGRAVATRLADEGRAQIREKTDQVTRQLGATPEGSAPAS